MSYKDKLVSIGDLEALVDDLPDAQQTVVLFHGYGADASDLFPLLNYIDLKLPTRWVFPEGPVEVPVGPGWTGRAWFPIDMVELEKAMMAGTHRDFSNLRPPGLDDAKKKALSLLNELERTEKFYVGGFSQGAMLITDLLLSNDFDVEGLLILSGILLDSENWKNLAPKKSGQRFFQSHGKADPLLDFKQASDLFHLLKSSGWEGDMLPFDGGHEIPPEVIHGITRFINN